MPHQNTSQFNLLFLTFLFILFSCNPQKETASVEEEKETVDISKMKRFDNVNEIIPDEFIRERKYIKLTSTDDDFLFKEINKVRLVNDQLFILDGRSKNLLVFDMDGVSIAKIGAKGNGPNEYIDIADFDIDSQGNIYTIDGRQNKLFIYNPDYSLKNIQSLPFEADILSVTKDDKIIFGLSAWNKGENEGASIIITDDNLKTSEVLAYYDEYVDNAFWVSHYSFVKTEKHIIYNKPINNDILLFTKKGVLEKVVVFDFGKKNVPLVKRKDIERNLQNFNSYSLLKWITIVDDNFLIGTFWENRETKSFFIDRKKSEMFVSNTTIDRDIGNVAGFDEKIFIKFINPGSDRADENTLPKDIVKHLNNGDFVLCIYELT